MRILLFCLLLCSPVVAQTYQSQSGWAHCQAVAGEDNEDNTGIDSAEAEAEWTLITGSTGASAASCSVQPTGLIQGVSTSAEADTTHWALNVYATANQAAAWNTNEYPVTYTFHAYAMIDSNTVGSYLVGLPYWDYSSFLSGSASAGGNYFSWHVGSDLKLHWTLNKFDGTTDTGSVPLNDLVDPNGNWTASVDVQVYDASPDQYVGTSAATLADLLELPSGAYAKRKGSADTWVIIDQ